MLNMPKLPTFLLPLIMCFYAYGQYTPSESPLSEGGLSMQVTLPHDTTTSIYRILKPPYDSVLTMWWVNSLMLQVKLFLLLQPFSLPRLTQITPVLSMLIGMRLIRRRVWRLNTHTPITITLRLWFLLPTTYLFYTPD